MARRRASEGFVPRWRLAIDCSFHVNRQRPAVELHDGAVDGGGIDRTDGEAAAGGPAAVGVLALLQLVKERGAVGGPGDALVLGSAGEKFFPAVVAQDVEAL